VLLVNPRYNWWWSVAPFGLGWIATSLERLGIRPKVIDCQVTRNYKRRIIESLRDYPTVGISSTIGTISSALEIASFIRQNSPKTRIIMGGPHPTAIYDKLLPRYADIVVLGEGEDTITELMQEKDLSKIKGIAYWDGSLKVNERRPLIEDLDRLGFPAWHLFDLKRYRSLHAHIPFVPMITSRGCPYQCIYCTKFVHGSKMRLRSVENVLSEIDYLVNSFGVKEIQIVDDNFTFYQSWVKELCVSIITKDFNGLRFVSGGIRADNVDLEIFSLLKKAGFYLVNIGVESGSEDVLNKVGKAIKLDKIKETINIAKSTGLEVRAAFMFGLPFDTKETMLQTLNFAKSLAVDNAAFGIAVPFPGTAFYEIVRNKGRLLEDLAMNSVCFYSGKSVYETDALKAKDIEGIYRKARRQFYFRPSQFWRAINLKISSISLIPRLIKYGYDLLFYRR